MSTQKSIEEIVEEFKYRQQIKDTTKTYSNTFIYDDAEYVGQLIKAERDRAEEEKREADDLLDDMWGLICNVNGGFVENETPEWYKAFKRIRTKYLSSLTNPQDKQ